MLHFPKMSTKGLGLNRVSKALPGNNVWIGLVMTDPTCTHSSLLSKAWAGSHSESPEAQLYLHPGSSAAKEVCRMILKFRIICGHIFNPQHPAGRRPGGTSGGGALVSPALGHGLQQRCLLFSEELFPNLHCQAPKGVGSLPVVEGR